MTDAWAKFWMAMAIAISVGAIAVVVSSAPDQSNLADWAQFVGSMIALAVVWWFSRQEAKDRRAEAESLRQEIARQDGFRAEAVAAKRRRLMQRALGEAASSFGVAQTVVQVTSSGSVVPDAMIQARVDSIASLVSLDLPPATVSRLLHIQHNLIGLMQVSKPIPHATMTPMERAESHFRAIEAYRDAIRVHAGMADTDPFDE